MKVLQQPMWWQMQSQDAYTYETHMVSECVKVNKN